MHGSVHGQGSIPMGYCVLLLTDYSGGVLSGTFFIACCGVPPYCFFLTVKAVQLVPGMLSVCMVAGTCCQAAKQRVAPDRHRQVKMKV